MPCLPDGSCGIENHFFGVQLGGANRLDNRIGGQVAVNQTDVGVADNLFGGVDILRGQCAICAAVRDGPVFTFGIYDGHSDAGTSGFGDADEIGIDAAIRENFLYHFTEAVATDFADEVHLAIAKCGLYRFERPGACNCVRKFGTGD